MYLIADNFLLFLAEFGDYDRNKHKPGYLHTLKLTSDRLSDDLNTAITDMHRGKLKYVKSRFDVRVSVLVSNRKLSSLGYLARLNWIFIGHHTSYIHHWWVFVIGLLAS